MNIFIVAGVEDRKDVKKIKKEGNGIAGRISRKY
jgi:hypothetical protein